MKKNENNNKKNRHVGKRIITVLVLSLLVLFLIGFLPRYFHNLKLEHFAAEIDSIYVRTLKLHVNDKEIKLTLPSSTEAFHTTPIWARVDGYLNNFYFDIGDTVEAGQLLAKIDTPELDKQYDQAKALLEASISRRDIAKISKDRWDDLYKRNAEAVPKQEVDERAATYSAAIADAVANEANVERFRKTLEFKDIIAPFDGIITQRNIDIGSLITQGSNNNPQQLFKIAQTNTIRVFVNVPQYYFRSIFDGQETDVTIQEFPNRIFKGIVARNAQALDPIARTLLTEVHIDNPNGEILVGLYAEVHFNLKLQTPRFIIPNDAVIIRAGLPQVAVIDKDNIIHLKIVKIGIDNGKTVEISDGLNEGDEIVINPTDKIVEGVKVIIQK